MDEKRLVVAGFGLALVAVVGYLAIQFIAALTVAVFLYYSTRRFYRGLARFRLPAHLRALITVSGLAIPLIALISYALLLIALEARRFIDTYPVLEMAPDSIGWIEEVDALPELTIEGLIAAYQAGQFDLVVEVVFEHLAFLTSLVAGLLLNLLIVGVVTYYLLIDGAKFHAWLLRFDEDDIAYEFFQAADEELEAVLFGNLLNVILISLIAIVVYTGYNVAAPPMAEVPYPALAGALTGIASLIPVVGMKIIYVPLAGIAAVPILTTGAPASLVYIGGFLLVAIVLVDTIPDFVLRPFLSGKRTHIGLLMLAYIIGPVVLGFYGLFFAPIVLVLALTFAGTALPRLLGANQESRAPPEDQTRLSQFTAEDSGWLW